MSGSAHPTTSAREDHAARVMAGTSEPMCWRALFDEIDSLRARLAVWEQLRPDIEAMETIIASARAWQDDWKLYPGRHATTSHIGMMLLERQRKLWLDLDAHADAAADRVTRTLKQTT